MTNANVMIGEKMWLASIDAQTDGAIREIAPMVRRVRVCDRDDRSATMRVVAIASGKELTVSQDDLHMNRKHAIKRGEQLCIDLDGQSPFGAFRYKYARSEPVGQQAVEVRMRQVSPDRFTVEVKFPGCRAFKACRGLRRLPLWEAEKVAADLRADREVRGRYEFDMTGERKRVEFFKIDRRKASSRPVLSN